MPTDASYSIADLARLTRLSVRTIRYWIAQGLVPASGESGPGAHYGQGHLDRLQLIQRLQAQYLPNAEIRRRMERLSDAEVATLVAETNDDEPPKPETSALEYLREVLGDTSSTTNRLAPVAPVSPASPAPPRMASAARLTTAAPTPPEAPPAPAPSPAPSSAPSISEPIQISAYQAVGSGQQPGEPPQQPHPAPEPPPERSQWDRLALGPDIELHIRRPLSRIEQRRVERLITIARQVLKEDAP